MTPGARPKLHFTAGEGWINDPLGLTYRDRRYHLFFQQVPGATRWAPGCHWGHATSPDLLTWTEGPIALSPGKGDDGCWSGSIAVPPDQDAVMFYTSVQLADLAHGSVRRALSSDNGWVGWIKDAVVAEPPKDVELTAFRDPFVFRDSDHWTMIVGAGRVDGSGTAFVYTSTDLAGWGYAGQLAERPRSETEPVWTGSMWECVQLVPFRDRHVLVLSVFDQDVLYYVACAVGSYRDGHFDAERWFRLTYGPAPYAASAYRDDQGRAGLIAWLRGVTDPGGGWAGAISVPTLLTLDGSDRPVLAPHPNVAASRQEVDPAEPTWPSGACVDVEWSPATGRGKRLLICDGADEALAEITVADRALTLTLASGDAVGAFSMPWDGNDIRLLLDGPVVEIFCAGTLMATPVSPTHQRLRLSSPDGARPYRVWTLVIG